MKKTAVGFLLVMLVLSMLCPTIAASAAGTVNQTMTLEPGQTLTRFVDGYYTYYNNQLALTVTVNGTSGSAVVGYSGGSKKLSNSVVEVTVNDCNSISIKGLSVGTATVTAKCFSQKYAGSTGSDSEWIKDTTTVVYKVTVERPGFTVSYNANGGSGAPASQLKTEGEALTLSTQVPTRSGYVFRGWAMNASASNAAYQPGDSYTTDSDVTLYAVWQFDHYVITYNANGGSGAPASQNKKPGTALVLSSTVPTRAGYSFLGWAESSGASSAAYQPGSKFTKDQFATLYAVWKMIPTQSISLNKTAATIYVDSTEQLQATIKPDNAPQSVSWSSDNPSVATVSTKGLISTKAEGTAVITATTVDGRTATCTFTVVPDPAKKIALNMDNFPNVYFLQLLQKKDLDGNGYLSEQEIEAITSLKLGDVQNISSTPGIELLTSLKDLDVSFCMVQDLDLRGCVSIETVSYSSGWSGGVTYDYLRTVSVDGCTTLKSIELRGGKLIDVNANGCSALTRLTARGEALLYIQLSGCSALQKLEFFGKVYSLNLEDCYSLRALECRSESLYLKTLDLRHCPELIDLYLNGTCTEYVDFIKTKKYTPVGESTYALRDRYLIVPAATKISFDAELQILKQPVNAAISAGETAKFQTFATGLGLSYQWQEYRNGTWSNSNYSGCDTNTLTISGTEAVNGSQYRCVVTDASGESLSSDAVTLSISYPAFGAPDFILPAGTRTIGDSAFEGIAAHVITVSAACTNIADHAFRNSSVQQIRIPAACTLGADVFDGCECVLVYGAAGSPAEAYCQNHSNCAFVREGN